MEFRPYGGKISKIAYNSAAHRSIALKLDRLKDRGLGRPQVAMHRYLPTSLVKVWFSEPQNHVSLSFLAAIELSIPPARMQKIQKDGEEIWIFGMDCGQNETTYSMLSGGWVIITG